MCVCMRVCDVNNVGNTHHRGNDGVTAVVLREVRHVVSYGNTPYVTGPH